MFTLKFSKPSIKLYLGGFVKLFVQGNEENKGFGDAENLFVMGNLLPSKNILHLLVQIKKGCIEGYSGTMTFAGAIVTFLSPS